MNGTSSTVSDVPPEPTSGFSIESIKPERRLLYITVTNDDTDPWKFLSSDTVFLPSVEEFMSSLQYHKVIPHIKNQFLRVSRFHVISCLKTVGCTPKHAQIIAECIFTCLENSTFQEQPSECNSVTITTAVFLKLIQWFLLQYSYTRKHVIGDFYIACRLRNGTQGLIVLLGGTSGCGKSTLSSLLASRLGIPTVLSTDTVRHVLREFYSKDDCPVLYASTYNAAESIDIDPSLPEEERILAGYKEQAAIVCKEVARMIEEHSRRNEPVLIEGVHLHTHFMVEMMKKYPNCIPFLVYISNDKKHRERFAVRAKYMTLDAHHNRYIQFFTNIRVIQKSFTDAGKEFNIPRIDNTNIDRSLAIIHTTLIACLRHMYRDTGKMWDEEQQQATLLNALYKRSRKASWYSSKDMMQMLEKKKQSQSVDVTVDEKQPVPEKKKYHTEADTSVSFAQPIDDSEVDIEDDNNPTEDDDDDEEEEENDDEHKNQDNTSPRSGTSRTSTGSTGSGISMDELGHIAQVGDIGS